MRFPITLKNFGQSATAEIFPTIALLGGRHLSPAESIIMATEIDPAGVMPRAILNAADFRGVRVLEVGAGDGRLTFQYAAEPRSVVGIDTKEPDIRVAAQSPDVRNCRTELRAKVHFLCASGAALPFPAQRFDVVLLASSL